MSEASPQEVAERGCEVMMAGDRASAGLGMQVVEVAPGRAVVTMTVREDMVNGWDIAHGGFITAVADTAFAIACNTYGEVTVAAGITVDFIEAGRLDDELRAEATERSRRGRSGVYDVTVTRGDGTVVAEFRGRSRSLGRAIS